VGVHDREFEEFFYDAEFPAVVRSVFVVCQDLGCAEELAQDAFLELLGRWGRVSRYDRPGASVRRVAIRGAVQATKQEARRSWFERRAAAAPSEVGPQPAAFPNDGSGGGAIAARATTTAVIALFHYEDLPVEDVAGVLGCSVSTVKVHLHRARETLRTRVSRTEGLS
jgi:RNA polymerase sigma-70 factor (ECF subfamily)